MKDNYYITVLLFLLLCVGFTSSVKRCSNCGFTPVPYPLSTSPDCGDQMYRVQCNSGKLYLNSANGSSYLITSITPQDQTMTIRPPGIAKGTCTASDIQTGGIALDNNLAFNVTATNSVILMNCTTSVIDSPYDCTPSSVCHDFIRASPELTSTCRMSSVCCYYKAGGSANEYKIRVRYSKCSAYETFINLDISLPVTKWPEPGLEIQWATPEEPLCIIPSDCLGLKNSKCLPDPHNLRQRKCFCKAGFMWDPNNFFCYAKKCGNPKRCKPKKMMPILIGGVFSAVAVMLLGVTVVIQARKRRARINRSEPESSLLKAREDILNCNTSFGKSAKIFSSKEILKATNNFSKETLLGCGGFGEVFKGVLEDGTLTAVKRAKLGSMAGINQILNEVKILSQVNHCSLVRLLGCCVELEQPLLIYEYVSNGTLFDHLHRTYNSSQWAPLSWSDRLRIAHQTAEGLSYLHNSAVPKIYHRDIKSSNILLDEKLKAKVADFGLSRLAVSESSHITTCARGTLGYLDPEYYVNFQLTDKSDVYSFGVVLLELLTSKRAIDFNREEDDVNLVVFGKKILREERLIEAIDPALKEGASKVVLETMKAIGSLAAACLDERRQNRPGMKEVADEIDYIIGIHTSEVTPKE